MDCDGWMPSWPVGLNGYVGEESESGKRQTGVRANGDVAGGGMGGEGMEEKRATRTVGWRAVLAEVRVVDR